MALFIWLMQCTPTLLFVGNLRKEAITFIVVPCFLFVLLPTYILFPETWLFSISAGKSLSSFSFRVINNSFLGKCHLYVGIPGSMFVSFLYFDPFFVV